jgi:ketol-acid reductoisomerase
VFNARYRQEADHPIEEVGRQLRAMMPWLQRDGGQRPAGKKSEAKAKR